MNATIELITTRERLAALVVPWRLLSERVQRRVSSKATNGYQHGRIQPPVAVSDCALLSRGGATCWLQRCLL